MAPKFEITPNLLWQAAISAHLNEYAVSWYIIYISLVHKLQTRVMAGIQIFGSTDVITKGQLLDENFSE